VFDLEVFDKPRNVLCPHAAAPGEEPGCRIYEDRPGVCRAFECAWKQGLAGEEDRPDRLGAMFYLIPLSDGEPGLGVIELREGAFASPRVVGLIDRFERKKPGRILVRRASEDAFRPVSLLIEGMPASRECRSPLPVG